MDTTKIWSRWERKKAIKAKNTKAKNAEQMLKQKKLTR